MHQAENIKTNQKTVYLAFGSNSDIQPQVCAQIIQTSYALLSHGGLQNTTISHFYQTPALPVGNGPDFANSVIKASTNLQPDALLQLLHDVEEQLGRKRQKRWGQRVIDIDLLDYDGLVAPTSKIYKEWRDMPLEQQMEKWPNNLILPHPRIQDRGFVLVPLKEIAPDWVHPVSKKGINQLIAQQNPEDLAKIVRIPVV